MTSIISGHHYKWLPGLHETIPKEKCFKVSAPFSRYTSAHVSSSGTLLGQSQNPGSCYHQRTRKYRKSFCSAADNTKNSEDSEDDDEESSKSDSSEVNNDFLQENLERMIGTNDSSFNGTDLATLIRKKYGRSYDVQLIKKEFMGKNLLALNVMWKYVEQRSFPLTEEEYILRLDDVANTLRCWGAVSHIRNSLAKSKERPRIGKAVSIFIDMDESGGRANEWIYK